MYVCVSTKYTFNSPRFDELYPDKRNPAKQLKMYRFDIPYSWSEKTHSYVDELRFAKEPIYITRYLSICGIDLNFPPFLF